MCSAALANALPGKSNLRLLLYYALNIGAPAMNCMPVGCIRRSSTAQLRHGWNSGPIFSTRAWRESALPAAAAIHAFQDDSPRIMPRSNMLRFFQFVVVNAAVCLTHARTQTITAGYRRCYWFPRCPFRGTDRYQAVLSVDPQDQATQRIHRQRYGKVDIEGSRGQGSQFIATTWYRSGVNKLAAVQRTPINKMTTWRHQACGTVTANKV